MKSSRAASKFLTEPLLDTFALSPGFSIGAGLGGSLSCLPVEGPVSSHPGDTVACAGMAVAGAACGVDVAAF
eukprot:CAMPEP_0115841398 /NCGR_PEP_ID=MMETSP0287-20121206/7267_1 /TAXON_ID=412157 /ORGANISM="Chrysochromulina rotalis, Strain UIO044" /LENGTH=71 /DNA_ID=CAMNT_0003295041 /DNA_START=168 /DNA_END=383 /DNA_ORIENTATION=-